MKDFFNHLMDPKFLIVAVMLFCLGFLTMGGSIGSEAFISLISVIIGYYFGSSDKKNREQ